MRESSSIKRNSRGVMKVKSSPDEGAARGDAVSIQTGAAASRGRSKQRLGLPNEPRAYTLGPERW